MPVVPDPICPAASADEAGVGTGVVCAEAMERAEAKTAKITGKNFTKGAFVTGVSKRSNNKNEPRPFT